MPSGYRSMFVLVAVLIGGTAMGQDALPGRPEPFSYPGNQQRISPDVEPTAAQILELRALERQAGESVRVVWDAETGSARQLSGPIGTPMVASARETALRFLADRIALLTGEPLGPGAFADPAAAPLRVTRFRERPGVDHVTAIQFHGDLRVARSGYTVSLRRRPGPGGLVIREVTSTMGVFFPGIPAGFATTPALSGEDALEAAIAGTAPGASPSDRPAYELVIYPLNGSFHLAWEVGFRTADPIGRWLVLVDASNGAILEATDLIMTGDVRAEVWRRNQVRDPGLTILPLRDTYVVVGGQRAVTDEIGFFNDRGASNVQTVLQGLYCVARNEDVADAVYSGPPSVLWSYPLADTHFDEVNTYHHTVIFHDYLRTDLGFDGANFPLPATVHVGTNFNNAYYDGSGIWFGDGDGNNFRSFAQDDVVYHEYGHFMFDMAINMGYGRNEVGGMNEGSADFFAGAFGDDSVLGEAVRIGPGNIRDMDNRGFTPPRIYPDYLVNNNFEPHRGGEVWGGALWDIRKDIGSPTIDRIWWEGMFYMPPNGPLFIDGRQGCVQANIDHFFGQYKYIIELRMWERGIGPPPMTDPLVRLEVTPAFGIAPLPVDVTAHTSDDGTIVSYDWDLGDGTQLTTTTPTVRHWYTTPGNYSISVVVTDDTGATASWSEPVEVWPDGVIVITPEEGDIGHVRSDLPFDNFFGDDDVYAGFFNGLDYRGAGLFRLPFIPGGTSNVVFDEMKLELTGQDATARAPIGGQWSVKLLDESIDADWRNEGYVSIVNAPAIFTLDPAFGPADLVSGTVNEARVGAAQLPTLHNRLAAGTVSFRIDGPYGVPNLFSWDSGYDKFDEDPSAVRVKPVLTITYTRLREAGDVNGDGVVNGTDARIAAEAVVGLRTLTQADAQAADADRNGLVDSRDVAAIGAKAAGVLEF